MTDEGFRIEVVEQTDKMLHFKIYLYNSTSEFKFHADGRAVGNAWNTLEELTDEFHWGIDEHGYLIHWWDSWEPTNFANDEYQTHFNDLIKGWLAEIELLHPDTKDDLQWAIGPKSD